MTEPSAYDPLQANADRFADAADLYDAVRPTPPDDLARLLVAYAGGSRPREVIDLGSGSGLSTRWIATWADHTTAVEPGDAMRAVAEARAPANVAQHAAFGHDTGLPSATADLVLAVQAFHWMEPESTLAEAARLLRPGGVFAALDCDWPPSSGDVGADRAWADSRKVIRLYEERLAAGMRGDELRVPVDPHDPAHTRLAAHTVSDTHADRRTAGGVRSWSKDAHLRRMQASGRFAWCHEVALHRVEDADAARFVGLLRSQGDHQTLVRAGLDDELLGVTQVEEAARVAFGGGNRPLLFTWRARIGVVARS